MCNDNNMFIDDETVSCGSNVQIPSFLWVNNTVSLLFCCRFVPGILGFQYGSVVKIPLAQAKCIFFLHSSIDIFPCENIPCPMSYSINDMLPSSAVVVQFPFSPKDQNNMLYSNSSCPWLNQSSSHFMLASHVSPVPPIPTICQNGIHENIIWKKPKCSSKKQISQFPFKKNTNFPSNSPFNQAIWHFSLGPERIPSRWWSGLVTPGAKIWGRRRQCESGDLRLMSNDWRDLVFYTQAKMWFIQPKFAETASIVRMILSCKSSSPL